MLLSLVLLSGGVDSAVALWWALNQKWDVVTLSFFFPGRRKGEIRAAKKLRKHLGSKECHEIHLPFIDAPRADHACYIPKRNLMFYGIAASLAGRIKADFIVGGHYKHDGEVFPDARKSYLRQIEHLIQNEEKTSHRIQLVFPFIDQSKKVIIETGVSLGVPFEHTWSCSHNGKYHCWKCRSCRERTDGFRNAGVQDPLYRK